MKSDSSRIYINSNTDSYKEFLRIKEQKKASENRINSLESQIAELQIKVATLEQIVAKGRGET